MKVTLKLARGIRELYERLDEEIEASLKEGEKVKDALAAVGLPEGSWGILLNGERICRVDEEVSDGWIITVLPPVSGG